MSLMRILVTVLLAAGMASVIYDVRREREVRRIPPQTKVSMQCMAEAVKGMNGVTKLSEAQMGEILNDEKELVYDDEEFYYALSRMCSRFEKAAIASTPDAGAPEGIRSPLLAAPPARRSPSR